MRKDLFQSFWNPTNLIPRNILFVLCISLFIFAHVVLLIGGKIFIKGVFQWQSMKCACNQDKSHLLVKNTYILAKYIYFTNIVSHDGNLSCDTSDSNFGTQVNEIFRHKVFERLVWQIWFSLFKLVLNTFQKFHCCQSC